MIWYLTIETGSTLILSTAAIANIVPMILVSPIAGVLADKMSRRHLMALGQIFRAMGAMLAERLKKNI